MADRRSALGGLCVLAAAGVAGLAVALLRASPPLASLTGESPGAAGRAGANGAAMASFRRGAPGQAATEDGPDSRPSPVEPSEASESAGPPPDFAVGRSLLPPPRDLSPRPGEAGPTSVLLRDGAGTPLPFASITLEETREMGHVRTYQTDGRGRLGIAAGDGIWPGRYRATVWDQAGERAFAVFEIEIPSEPERTLEIAVPGDARVPLVRGALLNNGKPWRGAGIADGDRPSAWCENAADGTFVLPTMPVDEMRLIVAPRSGAAWLYRRPVAVGKGNDPVRIELRLASLRGRVLSAGSLPEGAVVSAKLRAREATATHEEPDAFPDPGWSDEVPISAGGEFAFPELPPGTLVFSLGGKGIDLHLGTLELAAGEERTDVAWTAEPAWRVRGRVLDGAGEPLSGVEIVPARARIAEGSIAVTGPFGRFDVRLWASEEHLGLRAPGRALGMVPLEWGDSREIERDLRLP